MGIADCFEGLLGTMAALSSNHVYPSRPVPTVSPILVPTAPVGTKRAASVSGLAPVLSAPRRRVTRLASIVESTSDELAFDGKFVCNVWKHHTQTMADVRFRTPKLVATVMASTPINPPIGWPPHAHRSYHDITIVKCESTWPITPFGLAMWMEAWLQEFCKPEGGAAMAENRIGEF